ncbi:unnamed protein product [Allacma fusca]|uniref:Transposase n=1 Tax=Allacma fusca TaxID=39272 RepID=A0A8J2JI83_9HEXA|nr:unnamed protein product [Allacma fusca]
MEEAEIFVESIIAPAKEIERSKYAPEKRGGTSNRKGHLVLKHPELTSSWNVVHSSSANTGIKKYFQKSDAIKTVSAEEHNNLLMEFIILQNQPFSLVQAESFIKLVNYGRDPPFAIPKKAAIKSKLTQLYHNKKESNKFTIDSWSTKSMKSFQDILATWVDSDWNYQQVVLDLDVLHHSHSGKYLAESMIHVINEYEIAHKILAVTCDNASNMDTMMEELARLLKENDIVLNPADIRIRCLAHIINLACQASINVLKDIGKKDIEGTIHPDDSEEDVSGTVEKQKLSIYDRVNDL